MNFNAKQEQTSVQGIRLVYPRISVILEAPEPESGVLDTGNIISSLREIQIITPTVLPVPAPVPIPLALASSDNSKSVVQVHLPLPGQGQGQGQLAVANQGEGQLRSNSSDPAGAGSSSPNHSRAQWDSQWEFVFSCISMSVGLGNVWRFPVAVYRNGGGAFLIPYICVMVFIGRPIYFLELCLGQFTSKNQVWSCAPFFKGVGFGTMLAAISVLAYYCSILALPVYYFLRSFDTPLPWSVCSEDWAGKGNCNGTLLHNGANINMSLPELFFRKEVLKEKSHIEDGIGSPDWRLSLCLVFSWMVIYFSILRGVKSSGKVAYFTAIFPNVVLIIMLIRGVTLPGAGEGIKYFIEPRWEKLLQPKVWYEAATQCFFSLSTGLGSIIMYASYNPLHYNIYRASILFTFSDTFTSLLAGFITFAILGNLSLELGVDIDSVVGEGDVTLAFVSYPNAIAKMTWAPQFIAALFFLMLFTLGVGSAIANAAAISSIVCDKYNYFREWVVILFLCVCGCSIGLVFVTPGGQFILQLVDHFSGGVLLYIMSTLEVIAISWCYGVHNFIGDIEFMLKIKLGNFWKLCWGVLIPSFLVFVLIFSMIVERLQYNGTAYPVKAIVCGWIIVVAALLCFMIGAVDAMRKVSAKSWFDKFRMSLRPKYGWGPRNLRDREEWQIFISRQDRRSLKTRIRDMVVKWKQY